MIRIWFLVLPDTLLLDVAGPAEAFRLANQRLADLGLAPRFAMRFVGPQSSVTTSIGAMFCQIQTLPDELPTCAPGDANWVVVPGRPGPAEKVLAPDEAWRETRRWLRRAVAPRLAQPASASPATGSPHTAGTTQPIHDCRLITICVGALLAADAGLLEGRRCTTHHELIDALAARVRSAQVLANRVFVDDGSVVSSAGVTAGIDLALHLVAQTCGQPVAASVAQVMVAFARRSELASDQSALLDWRSHLHPAVHRVQEAVCAKPRETWTVAAMAAVAHVTPRHLNRLFIEHARVTPRDYVEQVRLALADHALDNGLSPVQAARIAGFDSTRRLQRARRSAGIE